MKLNFSIDYYNILKNDKYSVLLECFLVSEGSNKHNTYISLPAINKAYPSAANKPIVAVFDGYDFKEHARNEIDKEKERCIGCVPESNQGEIIEKDGRKWQKINIVVWKEYNPKLANKVILNKQTKISMEIDILKSHTREDGLLEIDEYNYCGICLLGYYYKEAIPGAKVNIIKFSDYKNYAEKINNMFFSLVDDDIVDIPEDIQEIVKLHFSKNPTKKEYLKDKLKYSQLIELENCINNDVFSNWFFGNKVEESNDSRKEYGMKEKMAILKAAMQKEKPKFSVFSCDGEYCYALDENQKMYKCKYSEDSLDFSTVVEMYAEMDNIKNKEEDEGKDKKKSENKKAGKNKEEGESKEDKSEYSENDEIKKLNMSLTKVIEENNEMKKLNMSLIKKIEEKEKEEKQAQAKLKYAEYSKYLSESDIEGLNSKLFSLDSKDFENELNSIILPKMHEELKNFAKKEPEKNESTIDYTLYGFKGNAVMSNNGLGESETEKKIKELTK